VLLITSTYCEQLAEDADEAEPVELVEESDPPQAARARERARGAERSASRVRERAMRGSEGTSSQGLGCGE